MGSGKVVESNMKLVDRLACLNIRSVKVSRESFEADVFVAAKQRT